MASLQCSIRCSSLLVRIVCSLMVFLCDVIPFVCVCFASLQCSIRCLSLLVRRRASSCCSCCYSVCVFFVFANKPILISLPFFPFQSTCCEIIIRRLPEALQPLFVFPFAQTNQTSRSIFISFFRFFPFLLRRPIRLHVSMHTSLSFPFSRRVVGPLERRLPQALQLLHGE
jgi:hypothetical protein